MGRDFQELKILIIGSKSRDIITVEKYLLEINSNTLISHVASLREVKATLKKTSKFNVILLDLSLLELAFSETTIIEILNLSHNTALIILTDVEEQKQAEKMLAWGVSDYLIKSELNATQLSKSIYYSRERKKAQRKLYESEEKYRMLYDESPFPMWVLDRESLDFLSVNKAALKLYGYSREEFLSMNVRDLWVESEKEVEKTAKKNLDTSFAVQIRHYTKSNKILHISIQSNPILFGGKEARVSLVDNITEKVIAEEKLKLSQQRFKAIIQDGSDLVSILDEKLNYIYLSPSATNILQINSGEIIGKNAIEFIHREDRPEIERKIKFIGKVKSFRLPSYRYKVGTAEWRWLETIVTDLRADPAVGGLVTTSRDITNFKIQEQKLKESLERYNIVAKATSDLITDYDVATNTFTFNSNVFEVFGYKKKEIDSAREWWFSKIHPEDLSVFKDSLKEIFQKGKKWINLEYRFKCADGTYKYILDRSYVISDHVGKPIRIIGSMQDITERRNYINTIEQHNKRLREIAWTQSHVVRAPLAKIMGLIELLKLEKEDIDSAEEILDNVLISAKELDDVIRNIANKAEEESK
ncbi:PAS domain S-box-containing protein [Salegentibacter echinorum]|uniref:histidine kinase n=1 Tax=Salegentibacter echinorum TaxID=1073325 RepID=A0A1M5FL20_SALEC|nr:PAS domain S-box protein [Salegentibacter echinorum]SHF91861.1 PAS domain S-box-containing protein [Salegentibacter echinorum]